MKQTSLMSYYNLKGKINQRHKEILAALNKYSPNYGPMTDYEITAALNQQDPNYVRPRRRELELKGYIQDSGIKSCSITGRKAHCWVVV